MFKHLLMFTYGDTSYNLLGIAIHIKEMKLKLQNGTFKEKYKQHINW